MVRHVQVLTICAHNLYSLSAMSMLGADFMYRPRGQCFQNLINKSCAFGALSDLAVNPIPACIGLQSTSEHGLPTERSDMRFRFFIGLELCIGPENG